MTILALAYSGLKTLHNFIFAADPYRAVEHLNDDLLRDIGMYRDAGTIINLNETPLSPLREESKGSEVPEMPAMTKHFENSSG